VDKVVGLSHDPDDAATHLDATHHRRSSSQRLHRRSFYTRRQLAMLEAAFSLGGHYPDQRQREQLAQSLYVTDARVKVSVFARIHSISLLTTRLARGI